MPLFFKKQKKDKMRPEPDLNSEYYNILFRDSHFIMLIVNPMTLEIVDANEKACEFYGYGIDEIRKLKVSDINIMPEEKIFSEMSKARANRKNEFRFKHRLAGGQVRDVEVRSGLLKLGNEELLFSIVHDITAALESEQKMKQLQKVVETSGEVILSVDDKGIITFINPEFTRLYGYEADEIVGKTTPLILQSGRSEDSAVELFNRKIKNMEIFQVEFVNKTKAGSLVNVEVTVNPVISDNGVYKGYIAIQRDITGRIKQEAALKRSEWLFSNVIESLPDPTFVINADHEVIVWNRAKEIHTGKKASEVLGRKYEEIYDDEKKKYSAADLLLSPDPVAESKYYRFERTGDKIYAELILNDNPPDGSERCMWITASTLYDEKGNVFGAIESIRDITDRKNAEDAIKRAKDKAEELSAIKSSLLANMNHEFRTPLMGILGLSDIMRKEQDDSELIDLAEGIHSSGKRLLSTLTSILSLSQLSDPEFKPVLKPLNLNSIVKDLTGQWLDGAERKGLEIMHELPGFSIIVNSDETLIKQALNNLLDNAVKFTAKGSVKVELSLQNLNGDRRAVIKVSDTGIGISKENMDLIFSEFRQVSSGYGRSFEGFGLGLTLTKKIIEKLGGKIEIQSAVGKGSDFSVLLPLPEAAEMAAGCLLMAENKRQNRGKPAELLPKSGDALPEVLFVEDNALNAMAAKIYLKEFFRLDHAMDGHSALEMVKAKNYNVILMDINLGEGLNGIEVMKEVRKNKNYQSVPIIAVTGYAAPEDVQVLLGEGFNDCLLKPFEKDELLSVIPMTSAAPAD